MTQDIDLEFILTAARNALSGMGNFSYGDFSDAIILQLSKQEIINLPDNPFGGHYSLRTPYNQQANQIEHAISEAFFYMFHRGFFYPYPDDTNLPSMARFNLSDRGLAWIEGADPTPEEGRKFMQSLKQLVPNLDQVVEQYMGEAVITYQRHAWFASAVMLGAAAEKAVYLLAENLHPAVQHAALKKRLNNAIAERKLPTLYQVIDDALQSAKNHIPYDLREGMIRHLLSFYEAIRVQRNDAVHPTVAAVSEDRVQITLAAFPQALSIAFKLIEWLQTKKI